MVELVTLLFSWSSIHAQHRTFFPVALSHSLDLTFVFLICFISFYFYFFNVTRSNTNVLTANFFHFAFCHLLIHIA